MVMGWLVAVLVYIMVGTGVFMQFDRDRDDVLLAISVGMFWPVAAGIVVGHMVEHARRGDSLACQESRQ